MQPRAVIYCSKHGATKEYAQCLGKKYNLPVISIDHISGYTFQNIPVYFCYFTNSNIVPIIIIINPIIAFLLIFSFR